MLDVSFAAQEVCVVEEEALVQRGVEIEVVEVEADTQSVSESAGQDVDVSIEELRMAC